jgi:uncharacterized protein
MNTTPTVAQASLDEIIRRIVEVAAPDRIILFGSAARGEMGPHNDLDLLVIKSGSFNKGKLTEKLYSSMWGVEYAVDIVVVTVVVTTEDVERYRDTHALVIKPALREGRVVYDAA